MRAFGFLCLMPALVIAGLGSRARASDAKLVVITPHNLHIQQEFEAGFIRHLGRPVTIEWIKQGSSELLQLLEARDRSEPGGSFGMDVFFGGGPADHNLAAQRGYLAPLKLEPEVLSGLPSEVAGLPMHHPESLWHASALSSFGILVNRQAVANQSLEPIETWQHLGEPRLFSWVVLADPRKSASVQVCYEAVLQQYGWEEGWPLLMQMAANSRLITASSSGVPNEIGLGNAAAGPCIDFYAHARIDHGGEGLAYVCPRGGTAITADPVSLLRNPPNPELARAFVQFVLSDPGQKLWVLPPGTDGGPNQHRLYRTAVRSSIYQDPSVLQHELSSYDDLVGRAMPGFDAKKQTARVVLLAELMGAALVDQHQDLVSAWQAMNEGGQKKAAMEEWRRLPFAESETAQLAAELEKGGQSKRKLIREWRSFFADKYEKVRRLSK